jgi:spermidine synthase
MTNSIVFACKGDLLDDPAAAELRRPSSMSKDAWRQLMPTMKVIGATLELR